jgi:hypothetical protein
VRSHRLQLAPGRLAEPAVRDFLKSVGEIDRIRSLGLEDLRREWRRLNHAEPPRISRDLLVLALGSQRGFELLNPETRGKRWAIGA